MKKRTKGIITIIVMIAMMIGMLGVSGCACTTDMGNTIYGHEVIEDDTSQGTLDTSKYEKELQDNKSFKLYCEVDKMQGQNDLSTSITNYMNELSQRLPGVDVQDPGKVKDISGFNQVDEQFYKELTEYKKLLEMVSGTWHLDDKYTSLNKISDNGISISLSRNVDRIQLTRPQIMRTDTTEKTITGNLTEEYSIRRGYSEYKDSYTPVNNGAGYVGMILKHSDGTDLLFIRYVDDNTIEIDICPEYDFDYEPLLGKNSWQIFGCTKYHRVG